MNHSHQETESSKKYKQPDTQPS